MSSTAYYVYLLLYPETGIPFYVGKGKGDRYSQHLQETEATTCNVFKYRVISQIRAEGREPVAQIYRCDLTEFDALELETYLIAQIGRRCSGGTLTNLTNGGEGTSGYRFTEEQRKKLSESHVGLQQTEECKAKRAQKLRGIKRSLEDVERCRQAKLGPKNPAYGKPSPRRGKKATDETKAKIREARAKQVCTSETRRKMSDAQKRRHADGKVSNETYLRISDGLKQAHIRKPGSWRYGQRLTIVGASCIGSAAC